MKRIKIPHYESQDVVMGEKVENNRNKERPRPSVSTKLFLPSRIHNYVYGFDIKRSIGIKGRRKP
jgi:hypothetical protein